MTTRQKYLQLISVLVLVFVVYNRRREAQIKYPNPDDDVRENIINYEDEGGGEDDMTAFDITPLQIPVAAPDAAAVAAMSTLQRQKMKNCEFSQHSIQLKIKRNVSNSPTACKGQIGELRHHAECAG